jgi:hypothetical protein
MWCPNRRQSRRITVSAGERREYMKESDPDNREQVTLIYPFLAIMVVVLCALIWRPRRRRA